MMVVATRLVASVGLNSFFQPWRRDRMSGKKPSQGRKARERKNIPGEASKIKKSKLPGGKG